MTREVIDTLRCRCLPEPMNVNQQLPIARFDRTLRAVMWMDAFLSVALVVVCVLASPVLATVSVPHGVRFALAVTAIGSAGLLAAFGAITAVVLMLRMHEGQYGLPIGLRLPLPAPMRPALRPVPVNAPLNAPE
jgi:hypothetical protein